MDAPTASLALPPQPQQRPAEFARVQPAQGADGARQDAQKPNVPNQTPTPAPERSSVERSFERDAETDSLVYRLVDLSSGIVTIQTPSDARLKLRAYIDGVMAAGREPAVEMMA